MQCRHVTLNFLSVTDVPDVKPLIAKTATAKTSISNKHMASCKMQLLVRPPDKE